MRNFTSKYVSRVSKLFTIVLIQSLTISYLWAWNGELKEIHADPTVPVLINVDVTISGTVTDGNGEPLPGVT
ncbi:MAG: hypothetical protein WD431_09645, partial [Cyclobacteriaceae bacterium]